jgi:hypothetical protein
METVTKRHPIRGFFYGIPFGLGLMLIAVGQGWAALGTWPPFIVLIVGVVAATLWGTYGPAKAPKGDPPEPARGVTYEIDPNDLPLDEGPPIDETLAIDETLPLDEEPPAESE